MVWGGILGGTKSELILWDKDNWGSITAKSYVDNVLITVLQPFWMRESERAGQPPWLMEDGASAHRAVYTRQAREGYWIPKFDWPRSSPDPNLIENVWYILKDMLNKQPVRPQGREAMAEAIREEWQKISEVHLLTFIDSMPQRIEAVLAASGGHTRW